MDNVGVVQQMSQLAEREAITAPPLEVKQCGGYDKSSKMNVPIELHPLSPAGKDCTHHEGRIRVFTYFGSPSDQIGLNGDFYLEEETNVLYGPKSMGAWPEDGIKVAGPIVTKRQRDPQPKWSIDIEEFQKSFKKRRSMERQEIFRRVASRTCVWLISTTTHLPKSLLALFVKVNAIFSERFDFEETASSKKSG